MTDSFVEFPDYGNGNGNDYKYPDYIRFKEGRPVLFRVLDKRAYHVQKHWINAIRASVVCPGEDCPICERSAQIRREHPDSFRQHKDYIPLQNRYMVNILDRTPVIKDPRDGNDDEYYAVNKTYPSITRDEQQSLAGIEPVPSNTVKLLEKGQQLFEQLKVYHEESLEFELNDDGEEEIVSGGITTFDVKVKTIGKGPRMTVTVIPLFDRNDDVIPIMEENELEPWELSEQGIFLTSSEIRRAVEGVALRDIFAARNANDEDSDVDEDIEGVLADSEDAISELWDE